MNTKTNAEMLQSIKQRNKTSRFNKAVRDGFKDAEAMILYLEGCISSGIGNNIYVIPTTGSTPKKTVSKTVKKVVSSKKRPVIHVIDIIDKSGSMSGSKDNAAVKGINLGVSQLLKDTAEVDYTYTLCDFSDDIIFRNIASPLIDVAYLGTGTRGCTALYDAIGESIRKIDSLKKSEDKVLVNIYTDGQENSSKRFKVGDISSLIEDLSKVGWTFTFIGTQQDVNYAQHNLKFHKSNTLVHDNTGAGMEKAFTTNSVSRSVYSSKVSAGEDVSLGFYKDIK